MLHEVHPGGVPPGASPSSSRRSRRTRAFALAHTALAHTYAQLGIEGIVGWEPELVYRRAKDAIAKALALDDGLGEAHGIAGLLRFVCDFDWAGAEKELRLALELSPGSADVHDHYGWLCSSLGRCDEALAAVRRARELDPLAHPSDVASELMRAGRYEEALREAVRIVELDPGSPGDTRSLGWAHLKLGHVAEGLAALERAAALSPEVTMFRAQLGQAYAMTGEVEKARAVLGELKRLAGERYVSPYHFAYVYTGLGEYDAAIDRLEHAFEQRAGALYGIKGSFLFADLQGAPPLRRAAAQDEPRLNRAEAVQRCGSRRVSSTEGCSGSGGTGSSGRTCA